MRETQNLIGQVFGNLTVIEKSEDHIRPSGQHSKRWLCKCLCGNEVIVDGDDLKRGKRKSCGCARRKPNHYEFYGETGRCYFNNRDGYFLFDTEDYDKIKDYRWYKDQNGYCSNRHLGIYAHRIIMDCPNGMVVDHINHNTLDNRKANLRICTQQQNLFNNHQPVGESGHKGISICKRNTIRPYMASIKINGKAKYLGCFTTLEEAIKVREEAEEKYFGEYAPTKQTDIFIA